MSTQSIEFHKDSISSFLSNPVLTDIRQTRMKHTLFGGGNNKQRQMKQESVRPRWPNDMRPSVRAEKYIRDASG